MGLFLNRTIQAFLQNCSSWMAPEQLDRFVSRLNRQDIDGLSATWELALAYSLSQFGTVQYEPPLGGRTFADFLFRVAPDVEFLCEVTTVSDEGVAAQNPSWDFAAALFRRATRHGIETKHIAYEFGDAVVGVPGKAKILLKIPKKADFDVFFRQFIDSHFAEIRRNPLDRHEIHVTTEIYDVHVLYDKRRPGASGQYRAYSTLLHLTSNPIYNILKEKARQLRDVNYSGIKGIFLCDAGSTPLRRRVSRMIDSSFSDEDIIWEFLRQNSSISFVQTYYIVQNREIFQVEPDIALHSKLFVNPSARHALPEALRSVLLKLGSVLPEPIETGLLACQRAKSHRKSRHKGVYSSLIWRPGMIKLPARALVDLLAGRLNKDEFDEMMQTTRKGGRNIVDRELRQGNTIKKIYIEENPGADDDWIVLEFEFDPAAGRFIKPGRT